LTFYITEALHSETDLGTYMETFFNNMTSHLTPLSIQSLFLWSQGWNVFRRTDNRTLLHEALLDLLDV